MMRNVPLLLLAGLVCRVHAGFASLPRCPAPRRVDRVLLLAPSPPTLSLRDTRARLLRELEVETERRPPDGPAEDDPAAPLAIAACRAGDARKARTVSALRVSHLTSATSFFVCMVGTSKAQINAIVKNVEDEMAEEFGRVGSRQGKAVGGWVCLDYDSVVVNIFSEDAHEYYGIEKYWSAAQALDLSGVLTPDAPAGAGAEVAVEEDVDDWTLDDDWSLTEDEIATANRFNIADGEPDSVEQAAVEAAPFDWSLPARVQAMKGQGDATTTAADPLVAVENDDDDDAELFASFGEPIESGPPAGVEAQIATTEEEEVAAAAAALLDEFDEDEADDAAWALGDAKLRALVERAERGARAAVEPSAADVADEERNEDGAAAGGWQSMMAGDGWDESALEAEFAPDLDAEEAAGKEEDALDDLLG